MYLLLLYVMVKYIDIRNKVTPRWIIYSIDIIICFISLILAFSLRFNFKIPTDELIRFKYLFPFVVGVRGLTFYAGKTYAGIIRYTSAKDTQRIFLTVSIGTLIICLGNLATYASDLKIYIVPFSVAIIDYMATCFGLIVFRIIVKVSYFEYKQTHTERTNVIIYGAGESGIITKRTLDRDVGTRYHVIGFIDNDKKLKGKKLEGSMIYVPEDLEQLLIDNEIKFVVISIQNISPSTKQQIAEICFNQNTRLFNVPPVSSWINGELSFKQIKKIKIEDLLERDPIKLDVSEIKRYVQNKRILVTGAAGSIGSGLVRQLIPYKPAMLILLDQAESPLYELEMELNDKFKTRNFEIVIGDVSNKERMLQVFTKLQPEVIFHAAAYKHVPLMENNPAEAIETNILGTKNLADLAVEFGVEKFVMISTDKAVNPTNIMGASKRIAEIYIQSLGKNCKTTKFVTTRFGNVLGSNGSVIPRFKKQIEEGGPITVTDPNITRYFMTIPEACQLVLEAGAISKGNEIFVFDMGRSVKIVDLAKKMIKLSGLILGKDIQLIFTGLRPGEKLYEELLNDKENTLPTHHPQILIGKAMEFDFEEIKQHIAALQMALSKRDNMYIVSCMKNIVPEYISTNSVYEKLDA